MLRTSFCFLLTAGILLVLYLVPFSLQAAALLLPASCLVAGTGIVLHQTAPRRLRRYGLMLIALAIGLVLGLGLGLRVFNDTNNYFRAYNTVSHFQAKVYRDSVPTSSGGFVHYLTLQRITSDSRQYSSDARGRVLAITRDGPKLFTGELVQVDSPLEKAEDTEAHFICFPDSTALQRLGFSSLPSRVRFLALTSLYQRIAWLGAPAGSLFKALFLGAREDLPAELSTAFEHTGTLHLLALSGLHVSIIYLLITLLLLPLPSRGLKLALGSLCVLAYLFLVGPRPSLLRATLILLLLGLGRLLDRETHPLNTLSLAALLILLADPASATSLSFQLSFLAVLGIITLGNRLNRWLVPWLPRFLRLPLSASLGAQWATAPLLLATFGALYPSSLLVTLLLIPVVTVFLWAGISLLCLGALFPALLQWAGAPLMQLLYQLTLQIARFFSQLPGLTPAWHNGYWLLWGALSILILISWRPLLVRLTSHPRQARMGGR